MIFSWQDGGAGVWSSSLHFQRGFILEGSTDSHTVTRGTSGPTLWVTDCTLMADCNKLVISTTARELLFYDISTTIFTCQYQIHGEITCSIRKYLHQFSVAIVGQFCIIIIFVLCRLSIGGALYDLPLQL